MVTTGAFQAARNAEGRSLRLGMSQRIVVVAPIRESDSGEIMRFSQDFPGRPSESANTRNSKSGGSCSMAKRRLFTFSPQSTGAPAISTCAFARELAATRFTIAEAGSDSEARTKKI